MNKRWGARGKKEQWSLRRRLSRGLVCKRRGEKGKGNAYRRQLTSRTPGRLNGKGYIGQHLSAETLL